MKSVREMKLEKFLLSKSNSRIKRFYKSAGERKTVGYIKGALGSGEECGEEVIVWNNIYIRIGKEKYSWKEADETFRRIIQETQEKIEQMEAGEAEQMKLFDIPGVMG